MANFLMKLLPDWIQRRLGPPSPQGAAESPSRDAGEPVQPSTYGEGAATALARLHRQRERQRLHSPRDSALDTGSNDL